MINILIIDDDVNARNTFGKILKLKGYNVEGVKSGLEGIGLVEAKFFNLVFVDLKLPDMSGLEVIKKINSINQDTTTIMMTAYASLETSIEAIRNGAFFYVIKPINIDEVLLLIDKALEKQRLSMENMRLVTELKEKNSELSASTHKLEHLAAFDSLTGLPNRRYFEENIQQILSISKRHGQKFALLIIDIDNFKWINDTSGHDVGDATLKELSLLLKKNLRKEDFIARVGGDEFAIILRGFDNYESVVAITDKILKMFQLPIHIDSIDVHTSVSIGVTFYPLSADDVKTLFKQADVAMYKAKSKGKNCVEFFSEEIKESYTRMSEIEHALQFAIEKKELYLFYQPIVNLKTNKIVGVEALLRWQNDKLGNVNPLDFIPIAESKGFINKIGLWSFEAVCKQGEIWNHHGVKDLFLAVNISPVQLEQENFTQQITDLVERYQVRRVKLEIELSGSILRKELNLGAKNFLIFLKQVQFRLAVEDFGTGYSNLTSLTEVPINTLKINEELLKNIQEGSKNYAVVTGAIALAKSLSLETIAEGVETKEQVDTLLKLGCELAQGFYYYKPMSAEEVTAILLKA